MMRWVFSVARFELFAGEELIGSVELYRDGWFGYVADVRRGWHLHTGPHNDHQACMRNVQEAAKDWQVQEAARVLGARA